MECMVYGSGKGIKEELRVNFAAYMKLASTGQDGSVAV